MILDTNLRFSNAQAVTATADSTNIIDTGLAGRDPGTGKPLYVVLVVTTAFTNTGTLTVALQGDADTTMTPDKTRDLVILPAASAVGDTFIVPLSPGGAVEQLRYINLKYTVNGTISAGNVSAYLVEDYQRWKAYADNSTIS